MGYYINSSHSKKLQHHWFGHPTSHLFELKVGVPLSSVKKTLSPLSKKNAPVMLYEKEVNPFAFGCKMHCAAQFCKNGRGNCRTAQRKTFYNEGIVNSNHLFLSSKYQQRHSGESVGLDRCFKDFTLRLRDLHDLHTI